MNIHMVRMKDERLPKISKTKKGCRKLGRLPLGWEDCLNIDIRKAEKEEKLREKARNREQWKKKKKWSYSGVTNDQPHDYKRETTGGTSEIEVAYQCWWQGRLHRYTSSRQSLSHSLHSRRISAASSYSCTGCYEPVLRLRNSSCTAAKKIERLNDVTETKQKWALRLNCRQT